MPLKLNCGLSRKIGLPNYGSLGASCNVEVELEHSLLDNDLNGFQERVRKVYLACKQAVDDELARHQEPPTCGKSNAPPPSKDGNGQHSNGSIPNLASDRQIEFARQLAGQILGLGVRRLEALCYSMHSRPLAALSSIEASALIDVLKDLKSGKIEMDAFLDGAAV